MDGLLPTPVERQRPSASARFQELEQAIKDFAAAQNESVVWTGSCKAFRMSSDGMKTEATIKAFMPEQFDEMMQWIITTPLGTARTLFRNDEGTKVMLIEVFRDGHYVQPVMWFCYARAAGVAVSLPALRRPDDWSRTWNLK